MTVSFEALTEAHLPLLTRWLQEPHVRAFWNDGEGETWGGDLLSGEAELTGRGLGPAVIRAFLEILKSERPALRRILIDPHPNDGRALRASAKAGFTPLTRLETPWGEVLLMKLDVP